MLEERLRKAREEADRLAHEETAAICITRLDPPTCLATTGCVWDGIRSCSAAASDVATANALANVNTITKAAELEKRHLWQRGCHQR